MAGDSRRRSHIRTRSLDLREQAATLGPAGSARQRHHDRNGHATVGSVGVMLTAETADLAQTALDSVLDGIRSGQCGASGASRGA